MITFKRFILILLIATLGLGCTALWHGPGRPSIEPKEPGATPSPIVLYLCGIYECSDAGIYHAFTIDTDEPVMWGFLYCDGRTTHPTLVMRPMTGVDINTLPMAIVIRRTDGDFDALQTYQERRR